MGHFSFCQSHCSAPCPTKLCVKKKAFGGHGDVLEIENMSSGLEETPSACLLHDLPCVAVCPVACWFRRGYLNRGPKSRLICHSAGRTGKLHRAAIWSSALCRSAPGCPTETQTSCLEREQERKERRKKGIGENFGGNVGHWGSYVANAFARPCVVHNHCFFPSSLSHFLSVQEMLITDRKAVSHIMHAGAREQQSADWKWDQLGVWETAAKSLSRLKKTSRMQRHI